MSGFARRLQRVYSVGGPPPVYSWKWYGSALDSTGGNMATTYDGSFWYCTVDIAGVTRYDPVANENRQWQQGRPINASGGSEPALGKGAAISSNGITAWSLTGTDTLAGSNTGGVHKRNVASGVWQLKSTTYYGDVEGTIGLGRRTVGHRRIYQHPNGTAVFIACQSQSQSDRGGIARSLDGNTLQDFDVATTFTLGRMFRALVGSENGFSDVMYACADSSKSDSGNIGGAPCVAIYTDILGANPTFTRIDTVGTGNPGGLNDTMTMMCINEGGNDVLYVVEGENDTNNGGIWRCVITGNPGAGGWTAGAGTLTWTKINGGTLASADEYRTITGQRVGSSTYLLVGNNNSPTAAGGNNPLTGSAYTRMFYRTLNGHTASPTWETVSAVANMSPSGVFRPVYRTSETWVQQTSSQGNDTNNSIPGNGGWTPYDMDIDEANQTIVVAGKSGSWICENPWAATASTVAWQPFSHHTGGVINHHVYIHPSDNLKWTMCDVDRSGYFSRSGGLSQMIGIEDAIGSPKCHANYIRQGGSHPGRWLLGDELGNLHYSDNWQTTAATFSSGGSTGAGDLNGIAEFTYASHEYRLATGASGTLSVSVDGGSWAPKYTFTSGSGPCTIIVNDGFADFWIMSPDDGLFYFPDVSNISAGTTVQTFAAPASVDNNYCGRVAQSQIDRNTLYVTWGTTSLAGLWKLTGANNLTVNNAGAKIGGSGTVSRMTGTDLTNTTRCGPIATDASVSSGSDKIIVLVPGYSGTPDAIYYDGSDWLSVADDAYREIGMLPVFVAMSGNRIYTSQFNSGVPFAVLN